MKKEINQALDRGKIAPQFALSEQFWCEWGIPLNPPLKKGDIFGDAILHRASYSIPPLCKRGAGGIP